MFFVFRISSPQTQNRQLPNSIQTGGTCMLPSCSRTQGDLSPTLNHRSILSGHLFFRGTSFQPPSLTITDRFQHSAYICITPFLPLPFVHHSQLLHWLLSSPGTKQDSLSFTLATTIPLSKQKQKTTIHNQNNLLVSQLPLQELCCLHQLSKDSPY